MAAILGLANQEPWTDRREKIPAGSASLGWLLRKRRRARWFFPAWSLAWGSPVPCLSAGPAARGNGEINRGYGFQLYPSVHLSSYPIHPFSNHSFPVRVCGGGRGGESGKPIPTCNGGEAGTACLPSQGGVLIWNEWFTWRLISPHSVPPKVYHSTALQQTHSYPEFYKVHTYIYPEVIQVLRCVQGCKSRVLPGNQICNRLVTSPVP